MYILGQKNGKGQDMLTTSFKKRIFSVALAVIFATTSFGAALPHFSHITGENEAHAALSFTDVSGTWFEMYVVKAINYGIVSGYDESNLFRPNNPVTRAEFCMMVNNAFGLTEKTDISFSDVEKGKWYYDSIATGINTGYILGYDDNTFKPNNNISRQEAAVIGERLLPYDTEVANLNKYPDYGKVADWSYAAVQRIVERKYMGAYDDGKLHPTDALTRAQAIKIICDIVDKETIITKDTKCIESGETYKDSVYVGDFTIDKSVAGGNVYFENCNFLGKLIIQGGGEKSIHLKNCRAGYVEIARTDNTVRVVAKGNTTVGTVTAKNSVILEEDNLSRTMQNPGFNLIYAASGATLRLEDGEYAKVRVTEGPANITLGNDAVLNALTIAAPAAGTSATLEYGSTLVNAYAYAQCHFLGEERVNRLYCFANGVTYELRPFYIETADTVTDGAISAKGELIPVMNPADGSTGISQNPTITISFSKPIHTRSGEAVTEDYILEKVYFTAKKEGGTATPFKAKINSSATLITITPTSELKKKSKFFIYFDERTFRSQEKNSENKYEYTTKFSSSFTCSDGSSDGVTFKPVNGARGQATSLKPSITFKSAILPADANYTELTADYVTRQLSFRKVDFSEFDDDDDEDTADQKIDYESNGKAVKFTAEIAKKNKGISITPKTPLEDGCTYYLAFADSAFKYEDTGEVLGSQYITFTVGYVIPTVTYTPKDGRTYYGTGNDVDIQFDQQMFTKDSKEIDANYIKNNVTFRDNTAGSDVAFTASITEKISGTMLTLNPVSLLADGHEFTVTVPENVFVNKDKKSPVNTSTSFTTGYTTPEINSISATGTTSVVTATVTANMVANGYVRVVPSGTTLTTLDQVKNGGTAFTSLEGSPTAISISGSYTGGSQYTVYSYIYSGSATTAIKSATVTITKDIAAATSFGLQGLTAASSGSNVGSAVSCSVASGTTAYTATLPFGSKAFNLTVNSASSNTVNYDTTGGSSFTAATTSGTITIPVAISDTATNKVVAIKMTGANKDSTTYSLTVKVAGNPALSAATFGGTLGKLGNDSYIVSSSATAITAEFTSTDSNATIQCSSMSGTNSGTGTLSGSIPISTTETTITVTVTSNQDTQTYTYKFTKLQ